MEVAEKEFSKEDIANMVKAYMACALWSSPGDDNGNLDDDADIDDIDVATAKDMAEDCTNFIEANLDDVREFMALGHDIEQVGHDYWLTRNRHGAGFWDRGAGPVGERLSISAKADGSKDLYLGDDGKVYSLG